MPLELGGVERQDTSLGTVGAHMQDSWVSSAAGDSQGTREPDSSSHLRVSATSRGAILNSQVAEEFPDIQLAPWGGSWSKDILVLTHNAFLSELRDLFSLTSTLLRRKFVLTRDHIRRFYCWFFEAQNFFEACMKVEEEYVYPWITRGEQREVTSGPMRTGARMLFFGTVRNTLLEIATYRDQFHPNLPVGERVTGLFKLVEKLFIVPAFQTMAHSKLPPIIENNHRWTPWTRSSVLRGIVLSMRKQSNFERNLVLLTRWMSESDAKSWIKSMLRKPKDLIQFGRWRRDVLENHCAFVSSFDGMIEAENSTDDSFNPYISSKDVGVAIEIKNRDVLEHSRISVLPKDNVSSSELGVVSTTVELKHSDPS